MLSEQLILQCETDLQREKEKIETWLAQHSNPPREEGFERGGELSLRELSRYNHNIALERLVDVKAALERINDGTFGTCIDCGKDIPEKRLLILPFAKRCVSCQSKKKIIIH